MPLGDRTRKGIENWFTSRPAPDQPTWGERLAEWGGALLEQGTLSFLEAREPELVSLTSEYLTKLRNTPGIPPEFQTIIDKSMQTGDIGTTVFGWFLTIIGTILAIFSLGRPTGRVWEYLQDRIIQSARLDPISALTVWRRAPELYARWIEDIKDQGWDDAQIEALKKVTAFYPSPQDLVTWTAREVFEPDSISKYGLGDEFDKLDLSLFAGAGVDTEQARNYWIAHWQHPAFNQVVEMLRRGLITDEDVYDWFRLVEVPPYWRGLLAATSWEIPTRVDVRRFWEYGTIDEERLREIYSAQGYHGKDLDDYVLWTKVYTAFPDLITRFKNGWISLEDVRAELLKAGMTAETADALIQTKVKAEDVENTSAERTKTRTDILKGVKEGVITREQGVELLMDLNYSEDEARFILDVNIPVDDEDQTVALRQLTKSDIQKALKVEAITEDDARQRLLELRYSPADTELLLTIFRAANEPPSDEDSRELTKADIIKGVKKGLLTQEEAYLLLQGLGYSAEDAQFILDVETEESPFSPRTYDEFKDRTKLWRNIVGARPEVTDDQLREAGDELVRIKKEVVNLEAAVKEQENLLIEGEPVPKSATAELDRRREALYRAQAELQRVQAEYDRLVDLKKWSIRGQG